MITKNAIFILSIFFFNQFGFGQDDVSSVQFLSNPTNKAHPLYDVLIKKDAKYIEWLYFHCKGLAGKSTLKPPMNKPIVFSTKKEGLRVEETIANCVHPKLYEDERELEWQGEIPLYGSFPEDINFHLRNDPKTSATIDLHIQREAADINMYVLTEEGDLVSTINDKVLKKGRHTLHWVTKDIKAGGYLLFTEIDTYLTIHRIHIEKNWWANLFSRNRELSTRKKVVKISYEVSDMPELQGEVQYVSKNRFGTSLGLTLLKASMVKINLYAINGDFISTIYHKRLNAGESEFLLDEYVEKSGWYFVQLSINGNRKHIKLKI